jgi:hypothetical protein
MREQSSHNREIARTDSRNNLGRIVCGYPFGERQWSTHAVAIAIKRIAG